MGYFNPIKGVYPGLTQIDKTLPVHADEAGVIVRGTAIYEVSGAWKIAGDAQAGDATHPGAYIYWALQGTEDLVAQMAGTAAQGMVGKAVITGLACSMPMEFETDQYEGGPSVNGFVEVADGGILTAHTSTHTAIGQVTRGVTPLWINDKVAVPGWRTGNRGNIITVRALYFPNLVTA